MRRYVVELVGVFALTLGVLASFEHQLLATPIVAGFTVGLLVYIIGPISGAQVNPAISVALWWFKKQTTDEMAKFIIAQLLGGALAIWLFSGVFDKQVPAGSPDVLAVWLAEIVGTAFLGFGVGTAVFGKLADGLSGLVVGGCLLLGILVATLGSAGVLNPAVAVGIGLVTPGYLIAPLLGGVLGMGIGKWVGDYKK